VTAAGVDEAGAPRPTPTAWGSVGADVWAAVLVAVRSELATRTTPTDAERDLLERPTSRLAAGRGREDVIALLAADAPLTDRVLDRLDPAQRALLLHEGDTSAAPAEPPARDPASEDPTVQRLRARVRRLRGERDDWRRRAEGAQAHLARLERDLDDLRGQLTQRAAQVAQLERTVAESEQDRARAVDRERRRRDAEVARLEEQLAGLRRSEEERRAAARRRAETARRATSRPESDPRSAPVGRLAPGRPTTLPRGVAPDTTEAARLLLGPGRLVLVDGYNVTRTHRDDLDLEGQRTWLVQRCVNAAAALRLRPVVVFDGQRAAATRPTAARQQVEVRFTPEGITADDELVLAVEATDEPVVVVTDDRELRDRVRASGADLVGTAAFLGVVGR
jgi:hypothetical protein